MAAKRSRIWKARALSAATILPPALMLAMPHAAQAGASYERYYTSRYNRCIDESGGGDFAIRDCIVEETSVQDARLNQAYKMVMTRLPAPRKVELRQAERLWIQKRDRTCKEGAAEEEGGTLWHVIYHGCLLDETIKQRLYLEPYK